MGQPRYLVLQQAASFLPSKIQKTGCLELLFGFPAGLLGRPPNFFRFRPLSGRFSFVARFNLSRPPLIFYWPVTAALRKVRRGYDRRLRNISDRRTGSFY
jgi:hypothetical protein